MVVRVGGSFAYLAGDGILTFGDHVRTVGDLRAAIEKTTKIPGIKQRIFTSGGRLCDDDSAILEAHKENPDGGHKMFMLGYDGGRERYRVKNIRNVAEVNTPPTRRADKLVNRSPVCWMFLLVFIDFILPLPVVHGLVSCVKWMRTRRREGSRRRRDERRTESEASELILPQPAMLLLEERASPKSKSSSWCLP